MGQSAVIILSDSTRYSGEHGQHVLYKQLGAGTAGRNLQNPYAKQKIDFKMLWQQRRAPLALLQPSMQQSLRPIYYDRCGRMVDAARDWLRGYHHSYLKSLLSLTLRPKTSREVELSSILMFSGLSRFLFYHVKL